MWGSDAYHPRNHWRIMGVRLCAVFGAWVNLWEGTVSPLFYIQMVAIWRHYAVFIGGVRRTEPDYTMFNTQMLKLLETSEPMGHA